MVSVPAIIRRFLWSAVLLALLGPTGAMAAYRPDTMALRQAQAFLEPLIPECQLALHQLV
jgi:hypothetical protein